MSDNHPHPSDRLYVNVAIALAILTVISYVGDLMSIPKSTLVGLVLAVAVVKATLVATYFMHLKFDWRNVRVMVVGASILSVILVFALMPDIMKRSARQDHANSPRTHDAARLIPQTPAAAATH